MAKEHLINNHPNLGVMCPIFSLPSKYGIGDFGSSKQFIWYLGRTKIKTWQILPLNITGFMDSPYQAVSSYGGDEMYVDIKELFAFYECSFAVEEIAYTQYIDYGIVKAHKRKYIRQIYDIVKDGLPSNKGYLNFLRTYPLVVRTVEFLVLKEFHNNVSWDEFHEPFNLENEIMKDLYGYHLFSQYTFMRQWLQVKKMAHEHGVSIMGDLPFYVGYDSADVYYNQDKFYLDGKKMMFKAGVPPDYFSKDGQLWGNPIYRWDVLAQNNYEFWLKRIRYQEELYDVVRLDHFRGFDTFWAIPGDAQSAIDGKWIPGPSYNFFDTLYKNMPDIKLVVEDLGLLNEGVERLRAHYNLRGMSVLQFMFDWEKEEIFKLRNTNTVLFSGTHDNQTLLGFYMSLSAEQKNQIYHYFMDKTPADDVMTNLLNLCLASDAEQVIIPLFDLLFLGDEARINIPSTIGGNNWRYHLASFANIEELLEIFKKDTL
ncbi:MAG: 4-alpha-glucanotransferase [Breznakia sp.]